MINRFRGPVAAILLGVALVAGAADPAPTPAVPGPAAELPAEYRIGPGDTLRVFVWNHADLSVTLPVRPDGMISTPLAENTVAAGKTATELARDLEKVLSEYVREPKVNVIVTEFVGSLNQIKVVGQAARPQSLPYRAGMTVLDVVIAVGGLGEFAAGNRAKIVRGSGANTVEIKVKLANLVNKGDMRHNVKMQPGDVLIIPESRF
jgi:polysaccharide export outer membrane protein